MRRSFLIFAFILFSAVQLFGATTKTKPCYLLIEKPGSFSSSTIFQVTSTLLNQFVETIKEFPPGGVSKKDCLYKMHVLEDSSTLSVSISGRDFAGLGNSEKKGIIGLQQALLRALIADDTDAKAEICEAYRSILKNECAAIKPQTQMAQKSESSDSGDIWMTDNKDDKVKIYIYQLNKKTLKTCVMEGDEYFFDKLDINDNAVQWDEETYRLSFDDDVLKLKGEDTLELESVDQASDVCNFFFFQNKATIVKPDQLAGIWKVEYKEEENEEVLYFKIDDEGETKICTLVNGNVDSIEKGHFEGSSFFWESDEIPIMLSKNILLLKGEKYIDVLTPAGSFPSKCQE